MTLAEVLVAAALTASLASTVVLLMSPADAVVRAEQDAVDAQQRQRVLVDSLTATIVAAADVITVTDGVRLVTRDASGNEVSARTFYFDAATHRVMTIDGGSTMPLADRVAAMSFEVLDASSGRLRVTAAIESATTNGRLVPPRVVTFEASPRRAR